MKEEFKRVSRKALHFVVLLALPVTVYFILYSRESIFLLASKTYENSIIPMQIIMPTVLLIGLTNVLGLQIMVPIGKEKMVFYSVLAGGIADFVANMIFIPTMSAAGAALGTLIAETVVLIVQLIVLRDWIRDLFSEVQWVKACVSTAVAGVACYGVKALNLSNFIALVISVCVFGAVYAVLLLIMREPLFLEVLQDVLHGKVKRGKAEKDGE
jgi:O-antigen/teichoic acid export membrane protein